MDITGVQFEALPEDPASPWVMRVTVEGDDLDPGAAPFQAVVGSVPVDGIIDRINGTGLIGFLATVPNDGDELAIGWIDGELFPTGLTYQPAVA